MLPPATPRSRPPVSPHQHRVRPADRPDPGQIISNLVAHIPDDADRHNPYLKQLVNLYGGQFPRDVAQFKRIALTHAHQQRAEHSTHNFNEQRLRTRRTVQAESRLGRSVSVNRGLIAETGLLPPGTQLLQSTSSFKPLDLKKTVVEGKSGRGIQVFRATGLFQEADKQNANGRVYPMDTLSEAVRNIQEDVSHRAVTGEYDHPPDAKIHLDRLSHLITKVWMEGKKVYGELEVLDNLPLGRCLRGLFERKVRTGISSRGVGDMEVRESGGEEFYEVMPGYAFVTWDVVAEPSVHGAILDVMEGAKRSVAPLREGVESDPRRMQLYQRMLLDEVDRQFGLARRRQ